MLEFSSFSDGFATEQNSFTKKKLESCMRDELHNGRVVMESNQGSNFVSKNQSLSRNKQLHGFQTSVPGATPTKVLPKKRILFELESENVF